MIYYIVYVSIWYVWSIWHFDAFRSHMLQRGQWSHWSMPEILLGSSTNSVFALCLQALLLRAGFWGQRRHSSSVDSIFHVIFTEHSAGVFFICSQIVSDPQMDLSRPGLANANQMVETGAPKSILGHRSHKKIQHVPCHIIDYRLQAQELAKPLVTRIWKWRRGLCANSTRDLLLPNEVMAGKKARYIRTREQGLGV